MKLTDHELKGCAPIPLAHYLKALGILRLVSEQKDSKARGYWKDDVFHLVTTIDELSTKEGLERFFLEEYKPTPVVDPWNNGSGFSKKDNKAAIKAIESGKAARFSNYRETIALIRNVMTGEQYRSLLDKKEIVSTFGDANDLKKLPGEKLGFTSDLRTRFSNDTLKWLDASLVLGSERQLCPALLGTGGNDGRLDFTNNFMQRLALELFNADTGAPEESTKAQLSSALWATKSTKGLKFNIGQFMPSADSVNPWDYVLMIEGTMVFQVSAVRKLDGGNLAHAAAPFAIQSRPGGYASASESDEDGRGEQWMPLWSTPATSREVQNIFDEGRLRQGENTVRTPIDAALSIKFLGASHGVESFIRYGFIVRNGLSNLAVPLDRIQTEASPELKPLREISDWVENFQRKLDNESASTKRLSRNIRDAMMDVCRDSKCPTKWQTLLERLAEAEDLVIRNKEISKNFCGLPVLSLDWAYRAAESTPEFRLALAMASQNDFTRGAKTRGIGSVRQHCVPVASNYGKLDDTQKPRLTWSPSASLETNLIALTRRRIQEGDALGLSHPALQSRYPALLEDVEKFISGLVDMRRVQKLARGLMAVRLGEKNAELLARTRNFNDNEAISSPIMRLSSLHALFRLALLRYPFENPDGQDIPCSPTVYNLLAGGQLEAAGRKAIQHLTAHGVRPQIREVFGNRQNAHRLAAALAFPVSSGSYSKLKIAVLKIFQDAEDDQ